jgi:hypothetical protein
LCNFLFKTDVFTSKCLIAHLWCTTTKIIGLMFHSWSKGFLEVNSFGFFKTKCTRWAFHLSTCRLDVLLTLNTHFVVIGVLHGCKSTRSQVWF